jgi:acyl-CoA thioester hydrolase
MREHTIEFRVRYQETDAQGRVHHANYLTWFEMGRVELLRAMGHSYRDFEESGLLLVVAELNCKYYLPASYDDLISLTTRTERAKGARIEHRYTVRQGDQLLAEGTSIVACIDRTGRVRRLPEWLRGAGRDPSEA